MTLPLILIVLFVGLLIGGVGIGGVLLVPALKFLGQIPLHTAIPACMVGYIATGLIGALVFGKHGSINWRMAKVVCFGALPGAFLGAWVLQYFSASVLEAGIAALLIFSGLNALVERKKESETVSEVPGGFLLLAGVVTGAGSALTGTGGPLMLIPILIWRRVSLLTAIGLAQVIQIPISLTATFGNFLAGDVNFKLGLILGAVLAIGSFAGARIVHVLPIAPLKKAVAILMLLVGMFILIRLFA
ncbi:MAG: sulfite exporter TauE/SafE family protein [Acidiferrobacterales bacterium]|nr:sulfite exporter TauE/SafE family protein [Acidiferrobacterales bacterium]